MREKPVVDRRPLAQPSTTLPTGLPVQSHPRLHPLTPLSALYSPHRDGTAKVGDVGMAKIMAEDYVSGVVGTLAW